MVNVPIEPTSEKWRVGPGFIGVDSLMLFCLVNVTEGSWQPELLLLPKLPYKQV